MKRIVVKVGSSSLVHESGLLNLRKLDNLSKVISDLRNFGYEIVLVSSGAIAAGRSKMQLDKVPDTLSKKQAVASVGQCELMYIYDKFFSQYGKVVAQMLMTKRVTEVEQLKMNAISTLETLLSYKTIPIINENDSVATDEIVYGDNDTLSAITASLIKADLLVLLTDIDGLYDKNPQVHKDANFIQDVYEISDDIKAMASDTQSAYGTGGMITKLSAAQIAVEANCKTVICSGEDVRILYDVLEGKAKGTYFHVKERV